MAKQLLKTIGTIQGFEFCQMQNPTDQSLKGKVFVWTDANTKNGDGQYVLNNGTLDERCWIDDTNHGFFSDIREAMKTLVQAKLVKT